MQITQNEATAAKRRIPFLVVRHQANSVIDLDFADITGGDSFTLTWDGQTTGSVSHSADFSAALQTAIEALSNFTAGDVEVVLLSGVVYRIYVGGTWIGTSIPLPTVTPTGFTMGDITGGVSDSAVVDVVFNAADLVISEAGGAFATSTGTVGELDHGIYYYQAASGEVDTLGALVGMNVKLGLSVYPFSAQVVEAADGGTILHTGLAQAATSNSITLASGASGTSDYYTPSLLEITEGTGALQHAVMIIAYNGTSKVATVSPPFTQTPSTDSKYKVRTIGAVPIDDIAAAVRSEILDDATPFSGGDIDAAISTRATPAQVATELATYDGPTNAEMVTRTLSAATVAKLEAHAGGVYPIVIGTGSTTTSIVLDPSTGYNGGAPPAGADVLKDGVLYLTSGAAAGQRKSISASSSGTLTTGAFTAPPTAGNVGFIA